MARSKRRSATRGGTAAPAAAQAAAAVLGRPLGSSRKRAPKKDGKRAQLTIPAEVWERATELADLAGTTPNDVLANFAEKGMRIAEHEFETAQRSAERIAAYRDRPLPDHDPGEWPTVEELVDASQLLRDELAAGLEE